MQYGQLHRRHRRQPASAFRQERRPLPPPQRALDPPVSDVEQNSRARYRVVRINGEWMVQIRQDNQI